MGFNSAFKGLNSRLPAVTATNPSLSNSPERPGYPLGMQDAAGSSLRYASFRTWSVWIIFPHWVMKQSLAWHLLYVIVHLVSSNIVFDSVHLGYHISSTAMLLLSMLRLVCDRRRRRAQQKTVLLCERPKICFLLLSYLLSRRKQIYGRSQRRTVFCCALLRRRSQKVLLSYLLQDI